MSFISFTTYIKNSRVRFKIFISKFFRYVYQNSPPLIKRGLVIRLKKIGILKPHHRYEYQFNGKFSLKVHGKKFTMVNYGGDIEIENFWGGLFNTWESDVGWIWIELCENSRIIFDIGANTGIYSLVAKTVNKKARVYAFEPSHKQFKKLIHNVELNKLNIVCEKLAVSNRTEEQIFYDLPGYHNTTASLSPEKMKNLSSYTGGIIEYKVKTTTLSAYIATYAVPGIDLIKLDIELHEPEAVEGLGSYLVDFKPVVIIEILRTEVANKLNQIVPVDDFFIFHLTNEKKVQRLPRFEITGNDNSRAEWNFIFFHKSLEDKLREETSLFKRIL